MKLTTEQRWLLDNVDEWMSGQSFLINSPTAEKGYYFAKETSVPSYDVLTWEEWTGVKSGMEDIESDFISTLGCLNCTKTPVNPENNLCLECQPKETKLDLSGNHLCMTCGQRGLHNCDYIETKPTPEPTSIEHTGLSVSYYDVVIKAGEHTNPEHNQPNDVVVSCNDIIEALGMNYAQANVFKAQWRIAAAAQGKMKKGNNALYDAEKSVFFSDRVLHQQKQ